MADQQRRDEPPGDEEQPLIRFGDQWIPAHLAWARMAMASEVADSIERFNQSFPNLSTPSSLEIVPLVRQRLKDISLRMPKKEACEPEIGDVLRDLLTRVSPEEAIEQVQEQTGKAMGIRDLICAAGEDAYLEALIREAREYQNNSILPAQTAQVWNDLGRPFPSGGLWSVKKVEEILA